MTEKMLLVESQGLGLVPWDQVSNYLVLGLTYFFKFFIIVGGAIPYVFQYAEIHHRRNASGFSLFVCLALCVANILRILFWFGKRFDNALLAQSIVMLICMILMLEIAVRMNRKHTAKPLRKSILIFLPTLKLGECSSTSLVLNISIIHLRSNGAPL
uniref:PQ-loop repeat-containing protein 1 n=1 Tax=Caenorhabditis tropicalis TaxID=1561998 RepID=A0A1I7UL82_9PELO